MNGNIPNANLKIVYNDGEKIVEIYANEAHFRKYENFVYLTTKEINSEKKQIIPVTNLIRIQYLTSNEGKIIFEK